MSTPGFIFGGNTGLSYEELQGRRRVLDAMLARQGNNAPKDVGEGLNALGQGILAGIEGRMLRNAEQEGRKTGTDAFTAALGALSGGSGQIASSIEPAAVPSYAANPSPSMPAPSSPAGGARAAAGGPPEAYASALPQSFLASVDRTEGGGDYDTLFGHSQRSGPFSNVRVSGMTVGQAIDFADPSGAYGQFVKGKVGKVATPMGRHQIVGTTLRNAAAEMGLDPSTPFNQQTQDSIAAHLARKRVASADTMGGKIMALRSEWEGFRHVPDAQMATIVADLENGGGMPAVASAPSAPVQVASNDPTIGVAAATAPQTPVQTVAAAMPKQQSVPPSAGVQRVAEAMPQMPAMPSNQIPPEALTALQNPYLSDGQRQALQIAIQQRQQGNNALYERQMAIYEQQVKAQQLQAQRAYETNQLAEQRRYDAGLLDAKNAREDANTAYDRAREGSRDARSDLQSDRDYDLRVKQANEPKIIEVFDEATGRGRKGYMNSDGEFVPVGGVEAAKNDNGITIGPDGTVQIGGSGMKLTEGQSKDLNYYARGNATLKTLEQHEAALADGGQRIANGVPIGGNYLTSKEFQLGNQAGKEFLASILRKDSGAALTKEEEAIYGQIFLPQPGDAPEVLAQKRASRTRALEVMKLGLGTATPLADAPVTQNPGSLVPGSDADPLGLR